MFAWRTEAEKWGQKHKPQAILLPPSFCPNSVAAEVTRLKLEVSFLTSAATSALDSHPCVLMALLPHQPCVDAGHVTHVVVHLEQFRRLHNMFPRQLFVSS